ncbi:hypothetical protein C8J57DRAFT_1724161, partial [Mycena rebaudengoi]
MLYLHTFPPSPMPPLTRQQTFGSTRSWWSDSNPHLRGPTINLHAAAKPLMKLLYNRQALDFIINNRSIPLSAMEFELYLSYLLCDYVSTSTKHTILEDLSRKVFCDPEALVADSNMLHDLLQLLEVPVAMDIRMWEAVRPILGRLAECEVTAETTCGSLVALLCDSRVPHVVDGVLFVLSSTSLIKFSPVTSGASVEGKLLDRLLDILEDSSPTELHRLCILKIVSNLVLHERTAVAAVEACILNHIEQLLRSRPANLYSHIFSILENLASHESTAIAVVRMLPLDLLGPRWHKSVDGTALIDPLASRWEVLATTRLLAAPRKATAEATCSSLVALACDSDMPQIVDGAIWLLSRVAQIQFPPVTTGVSVEVKLLVHLVDMLEAPKTAKWRYPVIFQTLSHLALYDECSAVAIVEANMLESLGSYESTAMAVVRILPLDLLGTFWRVDNIAPIDTLTRWWEGVTVKVLDAPRKATAEETCGSLVALLCDSDMPQGAVDGALWVLSRIPNIKFPPVTSRVSVNAERLGRLVDMLKAPNTAKWRYPVILQTLSLLTLHNESSAVAVVEANILNSVEKLLGSRPTDLYQHIFQMLESLASHESTAKATVHILPLDMLGTLWRYVSLQLHISSGVYKLIQQSVDDIAPIDTLTRLWAGVTAKLFDDSRKATAEATCGSLVALVCHSDMPQVVDGALWVLSRVPHIKFPAVTTRISVDAERLGRLVDVLKGPNTAKWRYPVIFQILSHLAFHNEDTSEISPYRLIQAHFPNARELGVPRVHCDCRARCAPVQLA